MLLWRSGHAGAQACVGLRNQFTARSGCGTGAYVWRLLCHSKLFIGRNNRISFGSEACNGEVKAGQLVALKTQDVPTYFLGDEPCALFMSKYMLHLFCSCGAGGLFLAIAWFLLQFVTNLPLQLLLWRVAFYEDSFALWHFKSFSLSLNYLILARVTFINAISCILTLL